MGHVTLQQQLRLEAELGLLGLAWEVAEPLVLQALRGAHPAAAGERSVKTQPLLLIPPQCPLLLFISDKETASNE